MDGVQLPQGYSHSEEAVYFLPISSQKSPVLILSNSEGWTAELTFRKRCSNCKKPFKVSLYIDKHDTKLSTEYWSLKMKQDITEPSDILEIKRNIQVL